jgi:hypothetical protein
MKRYIYITIGIIVAAAIAILILFLIKNHSTGSSLTVSGGTTTGLLPTTGTQGTTNSSGTAEGSSVTTLGLSSSTATGTLGTVATGQMTVQNFGGLSNDPVLDYFINPQNIITALEPDGEVITISNGQSTTISSTTVDDIISASFSYDGKKILVSYGDPTNPQSGIFTIATNVWTALPQGMTSPQWSPTNNYQIAYLVTLNSGKLALATINAANLKATPATLLVINADDLALQWPTKNEFILSDKPTSESAGSVWAFNPQAGTFTSLLYEVSGAESIWSHNATFPDGILFSNSSQNPLELQSLSGNVEPQPLSLSTLPSKCAFNTELMPVAASTAVNTTTSTASSTAKKVAAKSAPVATSTPYLALYCGIPRSSSGFSSAHLPDDYNTMALFTSDDIYKINTVTGAEQVLWSDATQNMDTSDMKFFNNALFFVNRYDQKLYGLTFN